MHSEEEYYHKADNLIRISCQALCDVFRQRWMHYKGSEWTSESAKEFVQHEGKQIHSHSKGIQRQILEKGSLEAWDLNLLIDILIRIKCLIPENDKSEIALKDLRSARNNLAHNAQKKMNAMAFQKFEDVVRQALFSLDLKSQQVHKLISQAGVSSSAAAWELAKKIQDFADAEVSKGNFEEAIKLYDDGLLVPSLLPVNLCTLYEQRASCYLEMVAIGTSQTIKNNTLEQALTDINQALNNNKNSWKAYSILAKIYKAKNDMENAIVTFTKALAMCPAETNLHQELDECKLLLGYMNREDHMDATLNIKSLEELVKEASIGSPIKMSPEMYLKFGKQQGDDVLMGQIFEHGWGGVEQNYEEAVRHFAKAAEKRINADGLYHLARMIQEGKGAKRDLPYALELFQKAANMPPKFRFKGKWVVDRGVQGARHCLGLRYYEGVGVPQDYEKAAEWFQKAVDMGCRQSANNLGIQYWFGLGVEQNTKMAERLFRKAVEHGNANAAAVLSMFYCWEFEPEKAIYWLERSIELGQGRVPFLKNEWMEDIKNAAKAREASEPMVEEMERKFELNKQGQTFKKRWENVNLLKCMLQLTHRQVANAEDEEKAKEMPKNFWKPDLEWRKIESKRRISGHDVDIIGKRAKEGSLTAKQVMAGFGYSDYLDLLWNDGPPFAKERSKNIIGFTYLIHSMNNHIVATRLLAIDNDFESFLESMFYAHCKEIGDLDKKIRICYAMSTENAGEPFGLEILKEGISRYPNEVIYYKCLTCMYVIGNRKENEEGLKIADEGLKRFPGELNLLYYKAAHTRFLTIHGVKNVNRTFETKLRNMYRDYLAVAPEDHYFVPDAYYNIALTYFYQNRDYIFQKKLTEPSVFKELDKILQFYEQGQMAENLQLPCYIPYLWPSKTIITHVVQKIKSLKSEQGTENSNEDGQPKQTVNMVNFLKNVSKVFQEKDYLKDPKRIEVIMDHRELVHQITKRKMVVKEIATILNRSINSVPGKTETPLLEQKLPKNLAGLQEITIQDMDPTQDKIYENKILNLTLIEDPIMGSYTSIHLVAMDDNKDVRRLSVYNVPHNKEMEEKLAFGCKLSILNPYLRVFLDGENGFRVDEPNCLIFGEKVESMCRYCGRENALKTCSKCKWAKYCSRDCQIPDWKELGHKLICILVKPVI